MVEHRTEIQKGERFEFGKNWAGFLTVLDKERIERAEQSLAKMLAVSTLQGKTFIDVGSGSGLFSLAARKLGAKVYSFDYDPQSVACTNELRKRFFPGDQDWVIGEASVLDQDYLSTLGQFDVVYSWGVLHHTGAMWTALENIIPLVKADGRLFVAIYNDQGWVSRYWRLVKRAYTMNKWMKWAVIIIHIPYLFVLRVLVRGLTGRLDMERGMSIWHDMVDWVGGYPFEVAKPEQIFRFYRDKGFQLEELTTCGGRHGCNEFVFKQVEK